MGQPKWMLVAIEGRFKDRRFPISDRGFSMGREDDNDLELEDDNVSRHHAVVRIENSWPVLEDLKSRNGTYVNNQRVARLELQEGDRIALGSHLFKVAPLAKGEAEELSKAPADQERTIVYQRSSSRKRSKAMATTALDLNAMNGKAGGSSQPRVANLARMTDAEMPRAAAAPPAMDPRVGTELGALELGPPKDSFDPNAATERQPEAFQKEAYTGEAGAGMMDPPLVNPATVAADEPFPAEQQKSSKRTLLAVGGGGALVILVLAILFFGKTPETAPASGPEPEVSGGPLDALDPRSIELPVHCEVSPLTEEEKGLPPETRVERANERFDQGARFMESDKLKEACSEFEKALLLNPDCKVCLIRLGKVKKKIKTALGKYKSDAIRAYRAMEYDKAIRFWEMALELESDPEGRRIVMEGIQKARAQKQKQSYR